MKKILIALTLLLPLAAAAQSTTEGGARASAGVEVKIRKGLHLSVEEEVRLDGAFKSLDRFQTNVELEYKPVKWMKLGLGYSLINPYGYSSLNFKNPRHRVFFDAGAPVPSTHTRPRPTSWNSNPAWVWSTKAGPTLNPACFSRCVPPSMTPGE